MAKNGKFIESQDEAKATKTGIKKENDGLNKKNIDARKNTIVKQRVRGKFTYA